MNEITKTLIRAAKALAVALDHRDRSPDVADPPPVLTHEQAQAVAAKALVATQLLAHYLQGLEAGLEHHTCPEARTACTRCTLRQIPDDWLALVWKVENELTNEILGDLDRGALAAVARFLDRREKLADRLKNRPKERDRPSMSEAESQATAKRAMLGLRMAGEALIELNTGLKVHVCPPETICNRCALGNLPVKWQGRLLRMEEDISINVVGGQEDDVYEQVLKHAIRRIDGKTEGEDATPANPPDSTEAEASEEQPVAPKG